MPKYPSDRTVLTRQSILKAKKENLVKQHSQYGQAYKNRKNGPSDLIRGYNEINISYMGHEYLTTGKNRAIG